jgi:hypothetical protein
MTVHTKIVTVIGFGTVIKLMTVDDSDDSSLLNEDEIEVLEFLHKALADQDSYFGQQVRDILRETCDSGAADHKKVAPGMPDASDLIKKLGI